MMCIALMIFHDVQTKYLQWQLKGKRVILVYTLVAESVVGEKKKHVGKRVDGWSHCVHSHSLQATSVFIQSRTPPHGLLLPTIKLLLNIAPKMLSQTYPEVHLRQC